MGKGKTQPAYDVRRTVCAGKPRLYGERLSCIRVIVASFTSHDMPNTASLRSEIDGHRGIVEIETWVKQTASTPSTS